MNDDIDLHRIGWKAFQDLSIAVVEEMIGRPVQSFLPTADSGRDGAFLGSWDGPGGTESVIQCKFTSKNDHNLTLSMLSDELPKAAALAGKGLAQDYIIITNHGVTGKSELLIKEAFQAAGVGRCRVFHRDWVVARIKESPRLRMMVPRLYGLMDLASVLDERAYGQAQLILSEMGDNLRKLVVTSAHKDSVHAISKHNLVLLLGSPAAGKSTIGASLSLGAADIWGCSTIKSTSPDHLGSHIDPKGGQFFWIDDAWGSTQYQSDRTEKWNQVFPLMQGAMSRGTRFLITSRDYIWQAARKDLKLQALPVLKQSQVIINVHSLTEEERARILYNHMKLGNQAASFRQAVKPMLPMICKRSDFLPESARRLGDELFTRNLRLEASHVEEFFSRPKDFLEDTIGTLSEACKAAIALIFLNGGQVRSPASQDILGPAASSFGVGVADLRIQLEALNGSLLNLAQDEEGPYWTYRHPTVGDAFAAWVAKSPEMVEIYLRGAKPDTILREVVCANVSLDGAQVIVPNSLHGLLVDRVGSLSKDALARFIANRSNSSLSGRLLEIRPDILDRLAYFYPPLKEDSDVDLLVALYEQGMLPEELRSKFVGAVRSSVIDEADDSFLVHSGIKSVLTDVELQDLRSLVKCSVLDNIKYHVDRRKDEWQEEYDPESHFEDLRESFKSFSRDLDGVVDSVKLMANLDVHLNSAVFELQADYMPPPEVNVPIQQSAPQGDSLVELFRDVDG